MRRGGVPRGTTVLQASPPPICTVRSGTWSGAITASRGPAHWVLSRGGPFQPTRASQEIRQTGTAVLAIRVFSSMFVVSPMSESTRAPSEAVLRSSGANSLLAAGGEQESYPAKRLLRASRGGHRGRRGASWTHSRAITSLPEGRTVKDEKTLRPCLSRVNAVLDRRCRNLRQAWSPSTLPRRARR